MHFTKKTVSEKRSDFVKELHSKKLLRFPGAYNPLCAKLIAEIGFDGVYVSGGVMSNDLGLPDIGLTTLEQVSYRSGQISRVTDLPTIVDIDTGFGNCKKTIEEFEKMGLSGCHLEDQIAEKRCGHLDNKELISIEEMVQKLKECVKFRKDKNFLAVAERICAFYGAELTLLHVVSEHTPDDETQAIRKKSLSLVSKIKTTSDVQILKSNNSIETISNQSAGYDLLILGTPQKDNWISVLFGTGKDKFTEKSACSVLRLTMKD